MIVVKHKVLHRFSGAVQFTAEIECDDDATDILKIGLAAVWGLTNGADLRGANFRGANLNLADLHGADLRGANLSGAYLIGANLRGADLRDADLIDANLRGASFVDADLHGADLRGAYLVGANLSGASLRDADLRDADLGGAPRIPDIHKAVYAAASAPGALDMSQCHHECGTAHCRAGWVVMLAGDEGKALEERIGTSAAAALIYIASDPTIEKMPDFYCSNDAALADMKAMANMERA